MGLAEVFFAAEFGISELEFEGLSFEVNSLGLMFLPVRITVFKFIARFSHILGRGRKCSIGCIGCIGYFCSLGA